MRRRLYRDKSMPRCKPLSAKMCDVPVSLNTSLISGFNRDLSPSVKIPSLSSRGRGAVCLVVEYLAEVRYDI